MQSATAADLKLKNAYRWDLKFKSKALENEYQKSVYKHQCLYLKLVLVSSFVLVTIRWAMNPSNVDFFELVRNIVIILNFLLLFMGLLLLKKQKIKDPDFFIILAQIYLYLVFNEISKRNTVARDPTVIRVISMLMAFIFLIPVMANCSWKKSAIASIIMVNYLNIRYTEYSDNAQMGGYPAIMYVFYIVFIISVTFFNERFNRLLFYKKKNDEDSLMNFQNIIKTMLPCAISIFSEKGIVFFNSEMSRLFNVESREELEEKLNAIRITEPESNETEQNESKFCGEIPTIRELVESRSLLDTLKNTRSLKKESVGNLIGFEVAFNGADSKANQPERCFEIKIAKISWELQENSYIIIINQDFATKRIQLLMDQTRYKDKVLATVSHNLRTPLNGIIGILELALESPLERVLKKR